MEERCTRKSKESEEKMLLDQYLKVCGTVYVVTPLHVIHSVQIVSTSGDKNCLQ